MKGFDYLSPEGFYDAIRAYGLPPSIIDLDQASQAEVNCSIRTAYGATDQIIIKGLTKQGGPMSPMKSALTTSLGHRYLIDLAKGNPGALRIQSISARAGDPHLPDDRTSALVDMVEAMDDSLLFAIRLPTLQSYTYEMDRFQYAYGWQTQWNKTELVVQNVADCPDKITIPSISPKNKVKPLNMTFHSVEALKGSVTFLRTVVDDPGARSNQIRDIIQNFSFPRFAMRLPITILRKIAMQCIISKVRAYITLQPLKQQDAEELDRLLASRVHEILNFPFRFNTEILTLPIANNGFDFPSIARMNASLAIEGLGRDLNHHIPAFRNVARITLADWMCSINGCQCPLDGNGLKRDFVQYYGRLPAAWITAQRIMKCLPEHLALRKTDQSHIRAGDVSITHVARLASLHIPILQNGHAWRSLHRKGVFRLSDIGVWNDSDLNPAFIPKTQPPFSHRKAGTSIKYWQELKEWTSKLRLPWMFDGETELSIPRDRRRIKAEKFIIAVASLQKLTPSNLTVPGHILWASDGSMTPATAGLFDNKSITCAVTGPTTTTFILRDRSNSILHGELMGLVIATLFARTTDRSILHTIYTDHLNSARLIADSRTALDINPKLRRMNGRSLYRWILANIQDMTTEVEYTHGHSKQDNVASRLNGQADYYATQAQDRRTSLLPAPDATFYMDEFTLYTSSDGWIEANPREYTNQALIRMTLNKLASSHSLRMAKSKYETRAPPMQPYTRALSAYTATVQLYARSGQLATASGLREKKLQQNDFCRNGCDAIEDPHHIFVQCPTWECLREEYARTLTKRTLEKITDTTLSNAEIQAITQSAKSLFKDCHLTWPLFYSQYYLGHIPPLNRLIPVAAFTSSVTREKLIQSIHADWHLTATRLTSRIYGDLMRRVARDFNS
jgi:hypothetical protein